MREVSRLVKWRAGDNFFGVLCARGRRAAREEGLTTQKGLTDRQEGQESSEKSADRDGGSRKKTNDGKQLKGGEGG